MCRLFVIVVLFTTQCAAALGAQGTQASLDPELRRLLESPFEAERARGVERLTVMLRADPGLVDPWLRDAAPELRAGVLRASARAAGSLAALAMLFPKAGILDDADLRREVDVDLLAEAYRLWRGEPPLFGAEAHADPSLLGAMRVFIVRQLDELAGRGTLITEHRALAAFSVFGPMGVAALRDQAMRPGRSVAARMLALSALARTDERGFFVTDEGEPSREVRALLDESRDDLKLGVLYGIAFRGLGDRGLLAEVARYAREDAFNEYTIEAALYTLHCRGRAGLREVEPEVDLCLKEFLDSLYSERARFHAAQLLAVRGPKLWSDAALAMVAADPGFSSYWLLAAILNGLDEIAEGSREAIEGKALALAMREDMPPQAKALALWYLQKAGRAVPKALKLDALRQAVLDSAAQVAMLEVDPDCYALRSALEILSFLGDRSVIPIIRTALGHESEAVRMVAAMAAGQGGFSELTQDLAALLEQPFEYAGFGAATALEKLGDERGLHWFASYLSSGNAVLMPAALDQLRRSRGKSLLKEEPAQPSDWRRAAALWRRELEAESGPH